MAWAMPSQPLVVPNPSCVGVSSETKASRAFAVRRRRVSPYGHQPAGSAVFPSDMCRPRRGGPAPARLGNRLMCCGRSPDGCAAESSAKERSASWTKVSEGGVAKEIGATGRSFLLATSSARGCGSRISLATAWETGGFVEQSQAGLGKSAFFRQGRGPLVPSMEIVPVVEV